MPTLYNKKNILVDFEQKKFDQFLKRFVNFWTIFSCSKSAKMKFFLSNMGIRNKLYKIKSFEVVPCGAAMPSPALKA